MPISAVDAISPAFQHSRQQLTRPFRAGQWARLAFVGLLAGELGSGGCSIPSSPGPSHGGPGFPHIDPTLLLGLLAFAVVFGISLWLLLMYVNSMMRFILFGGILEKECHIRRGWRRYNAAGFRYFLWQLLFVVLMVVGLTILIGVPAALVLLLGWFKNPGQHLIPLVLGGIVLFLLLFVFFVFVVTVSVMSKDFVVPQMALEPISALEGWRRLLEMINREKGGYAGYLGMKLVLAIAAWISVGIVNMIAVLLLLLPVGGLGVGAVLIGKAAGLTWNLYTITLAIVAGSVVLTAVLYVLSLISVPVIVFFPAYSIYFFAARYRPLALALYSAPPQPPLPGPIA